MGVQNLYTFPTPKTGIKQIEQFNMSPGLRKKAQDAVLRFLKFSVSVALTRRLRFLMFLRFSVYYAIYKMNRGFEIFEVFSFNRTDKAFEIFLSNGDSGYYTVEVPFWPPCFYWFFGSCFGSHDEAGLLAFEALQGLPRPARGTHGRSYCGRNRL